MLCLLLVNSYKHSMWPSLVQGMLGQSHNFALSNVSERAPVQRWGRASVEAEQSTSEEVCRNTSWFTTCVINACHAQGRVPKSARQVSEADCSAYQST